MFFHHQVVFWSLGILTVASCFNSVVLIRAHLQVGRLRSGARSYTIRILLMVPFYSIVSWFALIHRIEEFNKALEMLRKGYECIVIFAFAQLLVSLLGGIEAIVDRLDEAHCRHLPPISWLFNPYSWAHPTRFVRRTLGGVLQYVPISLFFALLGFISWSSKWLFPHVLQVCLISIGVSQAIAMYCLILFYHANKERLAPMRPIMKLVSIKVLVFFSQWQDAIVHLAKSYGAFRSAVRKSKSGFTEEQVCEGFINCMLIVEMFLLSVCHHWVYPPDELTKLFGSAGDTAGAVAVAPAAPSSAELAERLADASPGLESASSRPSSGNRSCQTMRRFAMVWNLLDTCKFWEDLRASARTLSSDNLSVTAPRTICGYCCNFFSQGAPEPDHGTADGQSVRAPPSAGLMS
eukprot:TRINITY_DN57843_c0_g1_i1.p1 TRINITY_DN57843_c0_g1~~TRINITY_DN57843_c0_g1_i1.p1  ORF type:complete len:422 (+),score=33.69 TRINITY_DN57843_c0_g1_i1:49-1266(+)